MSLISNSTDLDINNYTSSLNTIINHKLNANTMTKEDANILRNMLLRIQTNTKLRNAIGSFNESFLNLEDSWTTDDNIASSAKLASLLVLLLI